MRILAYMIFEPFRKVFSMSVFDVERTGSLVEQVLVLPSYKKYDSKIFTKIKTNQFTTNTL